MNDLAINGTQVYQKPAPLPIKATVAPVAQVQFKVVSYGKWKKDENESNFTNNRPNMYGGLNN